MARLEWVGGGGGGGGRTGTWGRQCARACGGVLESGGLRECVSVCGGGGGGRCWHKASVSHCLPLAAPVGLSPLLIPTLCGPERVLVVSTEPPDDLSCLTTPGVGRPGDGLLPVPLTRCIQTHTPSPCGGLPTGRGGWGGEPSEKEIKIRTNPNRKCPHRME